MAGSKKGTQFFCSECGYESSKWFGQCPACKAWNTAVEAPETKAAGTVRGVVEKRSASRLTHHPVKITEVKRDESERTTTGIGELDRVLGGGIVKGSLVLVGGDPGIGKSTLLLQMCRNLAEAGQSVLYISGEESLQQIRMRAERLGAFSDRLSLFCETNLSDIREAIEEMKPQVVIIDSIQTMYCEEVTSAPGSIAQVREATGILMQLAKGLDTSVFVVGHVTKEGVVAGPRMLEHMVDTVLYFEGDRSAAYRILRSVKNRFGSTNEIGVFEMEENGLQEVANPSEYMLSGRSETTSGNVVVCLAEGTRPMLVEVQALVCDSNFGLPRRTASGADYNRVNLLMAVMEKRARIHLGGQDAYVNVAGGLKAEEPGLDLGIVTAIASSYMNKVADSNTVVFGEVGLSGEIRAVAMPQQRVNEAAKLGFTRVIMPAVSVKKVKAPKGVELIGARNISQAIEAL
ncbi:MAG: DNA repair protein RadA [Lachnospiraceae bacterium]|jgi:DNA repair protein RadA/Sms